MAAAENETGNRESAAISVSIGNCGMSNGLPAVTTHWHMPEMPKDDLETRARKELDKLACGLRFDDLTLSGR